MNTAGLSAILYPCLSFHIFVLVLTFLYFPLTARMESNGQKGRVHISQGMAHALALQGKAHWYAPRPDKITAKGKGEMSTYWLHEDLMGMKKNKPPPSLWTNLEDVINVQEQKLVEGNLHLLEHWLKKIVAMSGMDLSVFAKEDALELLQYEDDFDGSIVDEVEAPAQFSLPFSAAATNVDTIELPAKVVIELHGFVKTISTNYNKANPFHSMHHSCHVVRSMNRVLEYLQSNPLLQRDPLALFVIVLTCMVSDLDHPGARVLSFVVRSFVSQKKLL